ncbi:MAG: hypothetical protein GX434_17805 [Peptococcaceae bacterium]|nr:hypothetical protein [Peptococcaceae bacterium]
MAKFITIKRKYFMYGGLVLAVAVMSLLGFNLFGSLKTNSVPEQVEPEMKILSIEFDPQIVIKDLSYGKDVFKGIQTMSKSSFKVSAVVQNMTEKTMNNVPIKITVTSLEDKTKQLTKEGRIPTLEPGATAKVAFENIKALGDGKGKSATAGQHEMTLSIKANTQDGMTQNTEARVVFNVDTSVK